MDRAGSTTSADDGHSRQTRVSDTVEEHRSGFGARDRAAEG